MARKKEKRGKNRKKNRGEEEIEEKKTRK